MEALSLDDAIFNDLTISNAHIILQLTGANLQEAVHLYKELTDPKERREYKKRKAQRRLQRLKGFFDPILKRFDPLIKKIKETITGEGKGS